MLAVSGKWMIFNAMERCSHLLPSLPKTMPLTDPNLWDMLDRHGIVILKPDRSCMGYGVIQVCTKPDDSFFIQFETNCIEIEGRERTLSYLRMLMGKRPYIVQLWIPLAAVDQRPFDLRVMVQRRRGSREWTVTGKLARVAEDGYIITNVVRKPNALEPAFRASNIAHFPFAELMAEIDGLSLQAAETLVQCAPKLRMVGLDIGIDYRGRPWIIEANVRRPALGPFRKVDMAMYTTIRKYAFGRNHDKHRP